MIAGLRDLLRRWLEALLRIDDTPERTAAAYAVGVFFGFSPFLGLHTVLGIAAAFVFRLNRVAVVIGVYSNLPWILVPYYTLATALGAFVTRQRLPPGFRERLAELSAVPFHDWSFWSEVGKLLEPLLWPYMVGSFLGSLALAAAAYKLAFAFVTTRRRHREAR
ncbi:MAG: DUF2062 domain-containing protein [Vicinamibacterales bacterium]